MRFTLLSYVVCPVSSVLHFLGDVIAGTFLGCTTSYFTVLVWNLGEIQSPRGRQPT